MSRSLSTATTWWSWTSAGRVPGGVLAAPGLALVLAVLLLSGCAAWQPDPRDEALQALREADAAALEAALEAGADPGAPGPDGRTLLHHGALAGGERAASLLVSRADDLDGTDTQGRTPLHEAAGQGHEAWLRALIQAGAEVDVADAQGRTPLMAAAAAGEGAAVEILLDAGADADRHDGDGATALALASAARYPAVAERLREAGREPAGSEALARVARAGDLRTLAWMLERGASTEGLWQRGDTFHSLADIAAGTSPRAGALLRDHGVELQRTDGAALAVAALRGDAAAVEALLERGVDPDVQIGSGDAGRRTPLMEAARLGHVAVVEALLEAGADPAARDEHGADALWHAAVRYRTEADARAGLERGDGAEAVVEALLAGGASPGRGDRHELAAIHAAAAWGSAGLVERLLDAGAGLEQTDRNGRTPLILAAQNGNRDAMEVLLERGADPRAMDHLGGTALSHGRLAAQRTGDSVWLEDLVAAGAARAPEPEADTPPLSVGGGHGRIMRTDEAVAVYDSAGYEAHEGRLLPYTTSCSGHGCLIPPVAVLPEGTVVELLRREVADEGRLHGVFLVQERGLQGLLVEDFRYGAWPAAGEAVSEVSIGRLAHIRRMPWVEAFEVDLPAVTDGLIW